MIIESQVMAAFIRAFIRYLFGRITLAGCPRREIEPRLLGDRRRWLAVRISGISVTQSTSSWVNTGIGDRSSLYRLTIAK